MMRKEIQYFCIYILLLFVSTQCAPVNVALNKLITATGTCGSFGPESYIPHNQIPIRGSQRKSYECEDAGVHPAGAMVDGNLDTWWQSASRERLTAAGYGIGSTPQATITLDMQQVCFL